MRQAILIAFLIGFIFGPTIIEWYNTDTKHPEDAPLVQENSDWKCFFGLECFTE
jgi:hypothetical protein